MTQSGMLTGLLAGVAGTIGLVLGGLLDPVGASTAYLAALLFGLEIALGALTLLLIMQTAGARWFVVLRRLTEVVAATLPVFAALFVPTIFLLPDLYPWALPPDQRPSEALHALEHREAWMNPAFFVVRAALYFTVWIALAELLLHASLRQRQEPARMGRRLGILGPAGLWPLALTLTLAGFDWVMSLDPLYASTMVGVRIFGGSVLAALATLVLLARLAEARGLLPGKLSSAHDHALGRLLLAFVLFSAYVGFSDFFIVYMADLPEEVPYYLARAEGLGWWLSVFLIVGRFAIPFLLLLSRDLKRRPRLLAGVSAWILVGHYAETAWLILPAAGDHGHHAWLAPAALLAVLGPAVSFGLWRLRGRAAFPEGDPRLALSARYRSS